MNNLNEFSSREALDNALAQKIAEILTQAVTEKGRASIAVSGGSTPKGLFNVLSLMDLPWNKVTITLADERWVEHENDASNTRLVHENLLKNKAKAASFFHLKAADALTEDVIEQLNTDAKEQLLPLDVLILGMGEDGHTASLFPCSEQILTGLSTENSNVFMKVIPTTAPHDRITFTYSSLIASKNIILHVCGESKKDVLAEASSSTDIKAMPIRAFLQHPTINTEIYWAE